MSALRPNYRVARQLKAEMDELSILYDEACKAGNFSQAQDIRETLEDMEQQFHLTGISSEYEL